VSFVHPLGHTQYSCRLQHLNIESDSLNASLELGIGHKRRRQLVDRRQHLRWVAQQICHSGPIRMPGLKTALRAY
jgi:hypothetical protein